MSYLALKGMIRRIHPDAGDILRSMPSNSSDQGDKQEAIHNLMDFIHPDEYEDDYSSGFVMPHPRGARFKESADPYGGAMTSPYDDEPNDEDMDSAYDEAMYYIETEHPELDPDDPDAITDLKYDTQRYLALIGKEDLVSDESLDQIIKNTFPASDMDSLKTDLSKDPLVKAQFGDQPKAVIDRYQKRDT